MECFQQDIGCLYWDVKGQQISINDELRTKTGMYLSNMGAYRSNIIQYPFLIGENPGKPTKIHEISSNVHFSCLKTLENSRIPTNLIKFPWEKHGKTHHPNLQKSPNEGTLRPLRLARYPAGLRCRSSSAAAAPRTSADASENRKDLKASYDGCIMVIDG